MTTSKLTSKQELFCQEILKGKSQTEAYINAGYSVSNMKDATIINNAYKLINTNDISTRIEELKKPLQKKFEYTIEQSFKKLQLIQDMALNPDEEKKERRDLQAALKAEDLTQKLFGMQRTKVENEITGKNGEPIQVVSQVQLIFKD